MIDLHRYLGLLEYELSLQDAEADLLRFAEVTMPVRSKPDDPFASEYIAAPHHRYMADRMMDVENGNILKLIINLPPRHGKSELCTKRFAAWASGRNPSADIIIATYNETFATDFAREVRQIMKSPRFQQVFPDFEIIADSDDILRTSEGGNIFFVGRKSSLTGRGGDFIIVDDPVKDAAEARSIVFREDLWQWLTQTLLTRRHSDRSRFVMSQTRWTEDDPVGRIIDKTSPHYSARLAEGFQIINLPALAEDDDPLGRPPGAPLWPERFGVKYLEEMREANAAAFSSLYQCSPAPEDGVFFRADELHEYDHHELPKKLTKYVVSDHAVGTLQMNDPTCIVPFGVCEEGNAWILPNIVWKRIDAAAAVTEMLEVIRTHNPVFWYAEKGHITKAIGPFLRKRMEEEQVYCPIMEEHPAADKLQRATSARGRAAQGRIRFPRQASWWPRAKVEMLKFPNGRHDDFVDCISMIGLKIKSQVGPGASKPDNAPKPGTFGHLKAQWASEDRSRNFDAMRRGW